MRAVMIAAVCMVGCYSPHYGDCEVSCASNTCPSGLECHDGMCRVGGMTGACGVMPDAAGSGSGSGSGAIAIADLEAAQRDALCNWLVRCRSFEDLATCRSSFGAQLQLSNLVAGVAAGKVNYDGNKARQCVNFFATATCERARAFSNRDIDPVCNEVFAGTLPAQATCYFSEECVSQDCSRPANCPMACCAGTCLGGTAPGSPTVGQNCSSQDHCVDSYCSPSSPQVCTAYKGMLVACASSNECTPGLSCLNGICRPLTATNNSCMATAECATLSDVCLNSVCTASGLLGTSCPGSPDACQLMHSCSTSGTANGVCQLYPVIGESCSQYPCREGYCDPTQICVATHANGINCDATMFSGGQSCTSGYCDPNTSTCAPKPVCN